MAWKVESRKGGIAMADGVAEQFVERNSPTRSRTRRWMSKSLPEACGIYESAVVVGVSSVGCILIVKQPARARSRPARRGCNPRLAMWTIQNSPRVADRLAGDAPKNLDRRDRMDFVVAYGYLFGWLWRNFLKRYHNFGARPRDGRQAEAQNHRFQCRPLRRRHSEDTGCGLLAARRSGFHGADIYLTDDKSRAFCGTIAAKLPRLVIVNGSLSKIPVGWLCESAGTPLTADNKSLVVRSETRTSRKFSRRAGRRQKSSILRNRVFPVFTELFRRLPFYPCRRFVTIVCQCR